MRNRYFPYRWLALAFVALIVSGSWLVLGFGDSGQKARAELEGPAEISTPAVDSKKLTPFPDEGLTDEERQARISGFWERNDQWVRDFVAQGRDPRDLRVDIAENYSPGVRTIVAARDASQFAIEGRVISTTYVLRTMPSIPLSIATVEVIRVAKGSVHTELIEVLQIGGPAWTEDGKGVLQQLEGDPLLLPEQHVVLLLIPAQEDSQRAAGRYQTVYGAGVYLATPQIQAQSGNAFWESVNGRTVDEVIALFK